jgi:hypothetical protein
LEQAAIASGSLTGRRVEVHRLHLDLQPAATASDRSPSRDSENAQDEWPSRARLNETPRVVEKVAVMLCGYDSSRASNICSTRLMVADPHDDHRPPGALPRGFARGDGAGRRPVWVHLARAHPTPSPDGGSDSEDDGVRLSAGVPYGQHGRLDLRGEVIGWLHHWERSTDGAWFGAVDYSIPLRGDFRPAKHLTLGLVPADALRPRDRHSADPLSDPR